MYNQKYLISSESLKRNLSLIIPLLTSQILLRLYPVVDNHYISYLGNEALLIHNIQANFITFGQFISVATTISSLIFWRRKECQGKQGSVLNKHIALTLGVILIVAVPGFIWAGSIMREYGVSSDYSSLAVGYLRLGLLNMSFQALYGSFDGLLTAVNKQKVGMLLSGVILLMNIVLDMTFVNVFFNGVISSNNIIVPIYLIACSTTALLFVGSIIMLFVIVPEIDGWNRLSWKQIFPVWCSELGFYLVRGIVPFVYAYQISLMQNLKGFWVTYQFSLQLSYLACLPLLMTMQIAVRNASEALSNNERYPWWLELAYIGIIPTTILLTIGILFPKPITQAVFHHVPIGISVFLPLFFIACWIGQVSNALTVPLRALKKSHLIARHMIMAEVFVLLGGTQILIVLHYASVLSVGIVNILFTSTNLFLRARSLYLLKKLNLELSDDRVKWIKI